MDFDEIPDEVDIKWARLYWHIWMPGDRTVATFCNATGCTDRTIDLTPANCNQNETEGFYGGGCGTGWVYWNVTDLVESGANNATVDNAPEGYPPGDGRTFQMYLVVVYEKEGYPQTNYWVNQGYMDLAGGGTTYTTNFGSAYDTTNGTLWQLALAHNDKVEIWFNGVGSNLVATTYGQGPYGLLEEYEIPAGWITTTGVNSMTWKNWDEYHHPALAIFMDSRPPGKDLIVEEIGFNPKTPRPDLNFAVTATVKNRGDLDITNPFNVCLYVNGVPNSTCQQVMSLGAGSSTPVTFPNVNLPEGCYEFKVVADIGDAIGESNENNNASTEPYQVGYVIIVERDSDFERLNTTGDSPLPAGCFVHESDGSYTIKDLTITNCAGDGITIENVNVPYVIDNCTIYNCTGGSNGVFLNNVTGGTVTGCTIHNNQHYGIKVGDVPLEEGGQAPDPKFVNITCNTIYQNYVDGIDLIGFDCTVKGNTVRDNAIYGIYVHGNNSKIYNNTVKDNDNYGIKLYNSSGNYVYQNDIIDNNDGGVQGNDTWKGLPGSALNTWNTPTSVDYYYNSGTHANYTR
jgi:parallel beta-helix repeat protein